MSIKKIVVVGGSAAGPKAAAKARRIDEHAEIIILQKDPDLSMASCGYPYYAGGFFDNRNLLLSTSAGIKRDPTFYSNVKAIDARPNTEVTNIDPRRHTIDFRNLLTGETGNLDYDKLIITTGATPKIPPVPGKNLKGVTTLQSLQDADFLRKVRDEKVIKKAVVIGGGLIGMEACESLHLAGIEVTVIELLPQILTFLDFDLAKLVENHVRSKSVHVITNNGIAEFLGENGSITGVKLQDGTELPCELAVVAVGVTPNVRLAREAGLAIGTTGGIAVNEYMQTSDPDIYAAGDCVETVHRITGKKVLAPFGDLANLQGRVAGENAVLGNVVTFTGTILTGICKVFDYSAGSTGLSESEARRNGYDDVLSVINASTDKPNFMKGLVVITNLVADKKTGKILGVQCVGPGNVNRQIAQWAMAIMGNMQVEDIINADLPYAPPFSLAIDHGIATAHIMQNKMKGRFRSIPPKDVKMKLDKGETPFFLDCREPKEFEKQCLNIGETLIPLGTIRKHLEKLPQDKDREIICFCRSSLRAYEASLILIANGWKNVKVMEGGITAWPYPEKK